jgi:hypothetical protein
MVARKYINRQTNLASARAEAEIGLVDRNQYSRSCVASEIGLAGRNQFSHSLALMAEIGCNKKPVFSRISGSNWFQFSCRIAHALSDD